MAVPATININIINIAMRVSKIPAIKAYINGPINAEALPTNPKKPKN